MNMTTRTFTLPDTHLAALDQESFLLLMPPDKALAAAIRLYQMVNQRARNGFSIAFVDEYGRVVNDVPAGLPVVE